MRLAPNSPIRIACLQLQLLVLTIATLLSACRRLVVVQAYVGMERMLIAENVNRQAGPGGLCDHNMGEQILFETAAFRGVFSVVSVSGRELHVDGLDGIPKELLGSRYRGDGGQSELWPVSTDLRASSAETLNDKSSSVAIGTVTINKGLGAGQTRRIVGLGLDDATLILDKAFGVQPDATSGLTMSQGLATDVIVRDNVFLGIAEHVDNPSHVATVLGFLWGNAHRFTYLNNYGKSIRQVFSMMPSNNSTQTDLVFRDTRVDHLRTGLDASINLNYGFQPMYGISFREMQCFEISWRPVWFVG